MGAEEDERLNDPFLAEKAFGERKELRWVLEFDCSTDKDGAPLMANMQEMWSMCVRMQALKLSGTVGFQVGEAEPKGHGNGVKQTLYITVSADKRVMHQPFPEHSK